MSKKSLLLGAIASIIAINSVFADTTVTSKQYVDTEVAKKQNIIETSMVEDGWHNELPSIASYDDDSGLVANKYGILTWEQSLMGDSGLEYYFDLDDNEEQAIAEKFVPTVAAVAGDLQHKENKMTCAGWPDGVEQNKANCWLWQRADWN